MNTTTSDLGSLSDCTFTAAALVKISQWTQECSLSNGARRTAACHKPGLSVEAMSLLSRALGFRYRVVWTRTYDELEETVLNGTADFTLNFLAATSDRWSKFAILPPLNYLEIGFANRAPRKSVKEMPIFRPFHFYVWICFLLTFVITVCLLARIRGQTAERLRLYPKMAFRLFAFTLNQNEVADGDSSPRGSRKTTSVLVLSYAVFLLLVQTFYSSVLVSILCPGRGLIPFADTSSLAELIAAGKRRVYAQYPLNSLYFVRIANSTIPGHVRMREAMATNPPVYYQSEDDLPAMLRNHRDLVSPITSLTFAAYQRSFATCSIKFVRDRSLVGPWESILVRRDFPHLEAFRRVLRGGLQYLIFEIARRDYYHRFDEAECPYEPPEPSKPTQLIHLVDIFYFWCCGLGLAYGVFVVEILMRSRMRRRS